MGGKKGGGKKVSKKADEDFDAFLKDLKSTTQHAGEAKKQSLVVTKAERKQHAKALHNKETQESAAGFQNALERSQQRMQAQQLQQLLQAMMSRDYLQQASTEKTTVKDEGALVKVACTSMQGWRKNMEDAEIVDAHFIGDTTALITVFDGHAGDMTSIYAKKEFGGAMKAAVEGVAEDKLDEVIKKAFLSFDDRLRDHLGQDASGSTCCSLLVYKDKLVCANVGDSRAVLCRGGTAIDLSEDHKPENEAERARIERGGGTVSNNRTNGMLAMSRALGDFTYKADEKRSPVEQHVIAEPDVMILPRTPNDTFAVVACDGIWDCMTSQEVITYVDAELKKGLALDTITKNLCDKCLAPPSPTGPQTGIGSDNMTVAIVKLL